MSSRPTQPFRFLDLPAEIRNNIYNMLLCSWDDQLQQDPAMISQLSRRCPSYSSTSLLRCNRQIHMEASDYMIKRNQFIRITCRGMDVRHLFLGDGIPVITTDARKVSMFNRYVMHMTLSKPTTWLSAYQFVETDIMLLRADFPTFCKQLDVESVMEDANSSASQHFSLYASIRLSNSCAHFLTTKIQERLLEPITTHMRGIHSLKTAGPIAPSLATQTETQIAQPRWTEPKATLEEIGTGVDVGKRQWQQNNYYSASESWAYAMRTLERMRHSSSWLGLKAIGGEDFVNKTADLYFTLNLLHAQFLQVDMASEQAGSGLVKRNGRMAMQHLRKCEMTSPRFAQHADATWAPSNQQSAKMMFRFAKCLRLMRSTDQRDRAVTLIEEAAVLAPTEIAIRDEKDAVLAWAAEFEETQRLLAQHVPDTSTDESVSLWSNLVGFVSGLAS